MSSILKALKKLQKEADRDLLSSETPSVYSRQTLRRRLGSERRIRLWVVGGITICLLMTGGWIYQRSRPVSAPVSPAKTPPASPVLSGKPAQTPMPSSVPASPTPEVDQRATPFPKEPPTVSVDTGIPSPEQMIKQSIMAAAGEKPQHPEGVRQPQPEGAPKNPFQHPGKSSPFNPQAGMRKPPVATSEAEQPVPFPPPATQEKPLLPQVQQLTPAPQPTPKSMTDSSSLPLLEGGLKLEALVWKSAPESRFVIINSQIVREGDMVEGARIERIEKEQVVLRKDGKLWQLRHRVQR